MTTLLETVSRHAALDFFGQSWEGRRVTVVGLGRSGVAAARLLCQKGCRVLATESRDTAELQRVRQELLELGVEHVELGGHTPAILEGTDLVVTSPGVPESRGPIPWAREQRLTVISEIELAFLFCPAPIVAVTGTNGKSTAVTLIAQLLTAIGRHAIACGNVGIPFSSIVDRLTPRSIAVVEVSSFQLLACDRFRPVIGVLLNLGTNHLDRHHESVAYLAAKARLFQRQTAEDWAVLNGADAKIAALGETLAARVVWFGENRANPPSLRLAPETQRAFTVGEQAVLQVARLLGIADPLAWQVIRAFQGLEHRLERAGTIRGVHFINDSKSTTPDSLLFALRQTRGEVVVIVGGRDKGMDFSSLAAPLREARVRGIVLIGEARPRLRPLCQGASHVVECETLEEAVQVARGLAEAGATVLFSPACASFDMFRDFEDRGRVFKTVVASLQSRPVHATSAVLSPLTAAAATPPNGR